MILPISPADWRVSAETRPPVIPTLAGDVRVAANAPCPVHPNVLAGTWDRIGPCSLSRRPRGSFARLPFFFRDAAGRIGPSQRLPGQTQRPVPLGAAAVLPPAAEGLKPCPLSSAAGSLRTRGSGLALPAAVPVTGARRPGDHLLQIICAGLPCRPKDNREGTENV